MVADVLGGLRSLERTSLLCSDRRVCRQLLVDSILVGSIHTRRAVGMSSFHLCHYRDMHYITECAIEKDEAGE